MRQWYRIQAAADQSSAELHIYGDIGQSYYDDEAVSAKAFMDDIKALPAGVQALSIRMNSFGGSVFDGIAIANALRTWSQAREGRSVTVTIDGIAASIASAIVMAGNTIRIADNALVMVHNPFTIAIGNAAEMRKMADSLDTVRDAIVATYQWHSNLSADELIALMDAETWMDADQAIANGFATEKVEGLKAAACIDPRAIGAAAKVPEQFKARIDALTVRPVTPPAVPTETPQAATATAKEILAACREANCNDLAESLLDAALPLADVQARVAAEQARRAEVEARRVAIVASCTHAGLADRAPLYVKSGLTLEDIRADLANILAGQHRAEIDGGLTPDHGVQDHSAGWAKAVDRVNNKRPSGGASQRR